MSSAAAAADKSSAAVPAAAEAVPKYNLVELLSGSKGYLVDGTGKQTKVADALAGKVVALYYSASWCGPCRQFTPKLAQVYREVKAAGKPFEVVFISSDNKAEDFAGYLKEEMPWQALPYEDRATKAALSEQFEVEGIPHLTLFNADGSMITDNGRIYIDAMGAAGYPWIPPRVRTLDIAPEVINTMPCLFVLMEGSPAPAPTAADAKSATAAAPAAASSADVPESVRTAVMAELNALGADAKNSDFGLVVATPAQKTGRWRGYTGVRQNPCIMITDFRSKTAPKFVDTATFAPGAATAFLAKYRAAVAGTGPALAPFVKSGVRPAGDADPEHPGMTVLTTVSFAEIALNPRTHVFVDMYADWCGPCKAFAPHVYRVARALQEVKAVDLVIAKFDADVNDADPVYLPETSLPTLKLFPKGTKTPTSQIKFDAKRTDAALLEWLHAKCGGDACFDLAAAQKRVAEANAADAAVAAAKVAAITAAYEKVIADKKCTFKFTGREYRAQTFWGCRTCNKPGLGVCVTCKETCHKGHDLTEPDTGMFFCDCGDGGFAPNVKCCAMN